MIDKSLRKAVASQYGNVVAIRMTGGPDCAWMNMYLDLSEWQMTCDSDIGSYTYHWGRHVSKDSFLDFCINWLSCEEWLLRKCIREMHVKEKFFLDASVENLQTSYAECHDDEDIDLYDFERALEIARGYDDADRFAVALCVAADEMSVELPEEWWTCLVENYTPWQLRFAEICREVIVPELKKLKETP